MILPVSQFVRLVHIHIVLLRHGLEELIFALPPLRPFRFLLHMLPWRWFHGERPSLAVRVRRSLEELGPIFIKLGQMLSTRRDLLSDELALELTRLQDRVPPFPGVEARAIIERELGQSIEEVFIRFDAEPMASASIAQVHGAVLHSGPEVVVKVVRPSIHRVIRRDLDLMYILAGFIERAFTEGRRLRPREVVAEYERTVFDELDLMQEAANASQLRRHFEDSRLLYVPEVHWEYTRRNVMVMERIYGIPVNEIPRLRAHGVDLKKLSERGVEIFFTQVFKNNFFHADMHPGNIFVSLERPHDPFYLAVDFGIVGSLAPADKRYLAENFVAFFNRDFHRVAELHVESGWVPPDTRVDLMESAIRTVCEPIFQRPLRDISFGQVLLRLFQIARRFNMQVQPQLVLLQKTLLHIEGLGRQLDPDLDLWSTAKPFLERWLSEQVGIRALANGLRKNLPLLAERLPEMPVLLHKLADQAAHQELLVRWESQELKSLRREMRDGQQRTILAIIGAACVVSAVLALTLSDGNVQGARIMAFVLGGLGGVILLLAWPRRASPLD